MPNDSPQLPNILLVMVDEQPVFFLGAYGHPFVRSPNVDALARRSAVFDSAYCCSPICAPCRAAMMTSRHVHTIEVWDNASPLRSDWPTFAHDFAAAGYQTILCGKMHFVGPDQLHGFTERWVPDIYPATFDWTRSNRNGVAVNDGGQNIDSVLKAGAGLSPDMRYDERVRDEAVRGLQRLLADKRQQPFLLVVSFTGPHPPYKAPQEYWNLYRNEQIDLPDVPEDFRTREHAFARSVRTSGRFEDLVPDDGCRTARHAILARTTLVDEHIGHVLHALEETRASRDTIVAYTADHGDMMGEHGLWFKNTAYEWSSRVPLLVSGPDIPPRRLHETVSLLDLGPTLIELAGIDSLPYPRDGRSLASLLRARRAEGTGQAIIENYGEGVERGIRTIVRGRHKLSIADRAEPELLDLETDPHEWHNVADDSQYRHIRAELESALRVDWQNPAGIDERRWQNEERRLAILRAWESSVKPTWQDDWSVARENK